MLSRTTKAQQCLSLCEEVQRHRPHPHPMDDPDVTKLRAGAAGLGLAGLAHHAGASYFPAATTLGGIGLKTAAYGFGGAAATLGTHAAVKTAIKAHVRDKYGLHGHIEAYKNQRRALKSAGASRHDLRTHYHDTIQKMAQHVARQTDGNTEKAHRSAMRALHGTYTGHKYI